MDAFTYRSAGNPDVRVFIFFPPMVDANTRLISVHHGTSRNALGAINNWIDWASKNNRIVVAPEFTEADWPAADYHRGNLLTSGQLNPESRWSFTIARDIALRIITERGLQHRDYDIQGHSAGGQFVHRMMAFRPEGIRYAFPCNAGVYTAPSLDINYRYGLKSSVIGYTPEKLAAWTNRPMFIFRGELDTQQDDQLSMTAGAMLQGANRFERAGYMYDMGRAANPACRWELHDVPDAGHDSTRMAAAVQRYLERLSVPVPGPTPEPPPTPPPSPSELARGARVRTTAPADVRNKLNGNGTKILCTQPTGALGTIVGGPKSSGGAVYWSVNFDKACDGWVRQDQLTASLNP